MRIPKMLYSLRSNLLFVGGLVLFMLLFAITYHPTYGLGNDSLVIGVWQQRRGLCLPLCCAIVLVTTALSRALMWLTTRTTRLREAEYFLWQLAEVLASALFCNLFLSLLAGYNFLEHILPVVLIWISVAIYPYAFYWLLAERIDRDRRIASAQRTIVRLRQGSDGEHGILRFADDKGTVRLVTSADNVVCIEAAANYASILYHNGHRLVKFALRNTLKGIEPLCADTPLIRCHRSYYININKVKLLRKTPDGLMAQMDADGVEDLPVSKSYAAKVMQQFQKQ